MTPDLQSLFQRITQGVYVIGVVDGEKRNAFTAACVMQASFDPLLIVLSINRQHSCYGTLKKGGVFSVNVLKKGQLDVAAHYGRPAHTDKLASTAWTTGLTGAPLLDDALAWFECEAVAEHPAGDHVLVLGKVVGGELIDEKAEPDLSRDRRHGRRVGALSEEVLKGAPTRRCARDFRLRLASPAPLIPAFAGRPEAAGVLR